jgi:hypothetical protein
MLQTPLYTASYNPKNGFIEVALNLDRPDREAREVRSYGKKFQISINDMDSGVQNSNLERAWNIVMTRLIHHQVYKVKVLPPDVQLEQSSLDRGKQITIYAFQDIKTPDEWQEILRDIEYHLATAVPPIQPSYRPSLCSRIVPGSHYISYRDDSEVDIHGRRVYKKPTNTPDLRLGGADDEYRNIAIPAEMPECPSFLVEMHSNGADNIPAWTATYTMPHSDSATDSGHSLSASSE